MPTDQWIPVPSRNEGIEILADGTLMLHALRAQKLTFDAVYDETGTSTNGTLLSLTPRKIRMTIAVPLDHAIKFGYKLSGVNSPLPTGPGNSTVSEELDLSGYARAHYVSSDKYEKWLRKDSFPVPNTIYDPKIPGPTPKAPDKLGSGTDPKAALRDDIVYLQNEAKRNLEEVGRMQGSRSIILKGLCLQYQPGDEIGEIGSAQVNKIIKEVILHTGNGATMTTELILE